MKHENTLFSKNLLNWYDINKRTLDVKIKTGLQPYQYPNLQVGTEIKKKRIGVGPKDYKTVEVEEPVYEQANLEKMEEITANVTS